jgi:hypothetical protein
MVVTESIPAGFGVRKGETGDLENPECGRAAGEFEHRRRNRRAEGFVSQIVAQPVDSLSALV